MDIKEYNGTSLAYIGDAVMSLYVREMLLELGYQKPNVLQKKSVAWVSAKAQADFFDEIKREKLLHRRGMEYHTAWQKYEYFLSCEKRQCTDLPLIHRTGSTFWLFVSYETRNTSKRALAGDKRNWRIGL